MASMRVTVFTLSCLLSTVARAQAPIPGAEAIDEPLHTVTVELSRDGATLRVERALFNPTLSHARVDLPIPIPCGATLAEFTIAELDPSGAPVWKPAELLAPSAASDQFDGYFASTFSAPSHAANSDTGMLLTRASWSCEAQLAIFPIPPLQRREFAYELFVPSSYGEGRYTIELPSFDAYGRTPELVVAASPDDLSAWIDTQELGASGATISGARAHTIVLSPRHDGRGRGRVRVADLDLAALVAQTPAAAALQASDGSALPRLQEAAFEAPIELATLPAVRRAVVLIDASRSVSADEREQMQRIAGEYFAALAEQQARVEVVLFDRDVERLYHDFVPASWGAEDLPKLTIADGNGSEVGEALAFARGLLAEPTERAGADWIVVFSDLALRSDFDVAAEQALAERSGVRVHVVRQTPFAPAFGPAASTDPWTAIARASGGMAWDSNGDQLGIAAELVRPTRIWNPSLELAFADASHLSESLGPFLEAGEQTGWANHTSTGPALAQVSFVGEVWGQRRAWTEQPSAIVGERLAGALVSAQTQPGLSEAAATALAFHARVISAYSSAWALAKFDGTAPAPSLRLGLSSHGFGGSYGHSSHCGGVRSSRREGIHTVVSFETLAQAALDRCPNQADGSFAFETTGIEIVAVMNASACLDAQTWATDIRPTEAVGRKRITVAHAQGLVTSVAIAVL